MKLDRDSLFNVIAFSPDPLLFYNVCKDYREACDYYVYNYRVKNGQIKEFKVGKKKIIKFGYYNCTDAITRKRKLGYKSIYILMSRYYITSDLQVTEQEIRNIFRYQIVPQNIILFVIKYHFKNLYNKRFIKYKSEILEECYQLISKHQTITVPTIKDIYNLDSSCGIEYLKTYLTYIKGDKLLSFIRTNEEFNYIKDILLENGAMKILILYFRIFYSRRGGKYGEVFKKFKIEPHKNLQSNKLLKYIFETYFGNKLNINTDEFVYRK